MEDTGYWVEISQGGARLGAGLRLTRHYALTALHCLRGSDADAELDLFFANGEQIQGRIGERSPEADLALIEILQPSRPDVFLPPNADLATRGDVWFSPYRPSSCDPQLTGLVSSGSMPYACEGGLEIEALQLEVDQPISDYSGYSGSPVERDAASGGAALLGVLLEEFPDRRDPGRAANVLFAATIGEALRRFDYLGVGHLRAALRAVHDEPPGRPAAMVPARSEPPVTQVSVSIQPAAAGPIAAASAIVALFQDWANTGVLPQAHVPALVLRVASRLADGDWTGS